MEFPIAWYILKTYTIEVKVEFSMAGYIRKDYTIVNVYIQTKCFGGLSNGLLHT